MSQTDISRIVLGTAGHIDHGKTSLVKALTGTDTDRLKEEKARGITIELGFATLDLPGDKKMSIVDVPGHERFVRNMVAGASGIDIVLFVVAADEGVMPQTREHLDICVLLGIENGMIALTKIDMVDPDFVELAREDVASAVEGTFLEGAPMIPVSAVTGEGVAEVRQTLEKLAESVRSRHAKGLFRIPVDRVFTMKGFGTVVTGTAQSGSVKKDDEVQVMPGGALAKVRGIEVHGDHLDKAYAGNRTALNLSGISLDEVSRGDVITHPGSFSPTRMVDVRVEVLPSARPLESRTRCRMHIGTREVPVVVALLDREILEPGQWAYAQVRSREQFLTCPGDRFVFRAFSPAHTIGGGVVLDPAPLRHKGIKPEVTRTLSILNAEDEGDRLGAYFRLRRHIGLTPNDVQSLMDVTGDRVHVLLNDSVRLGHALVVDKKTKRHVDVGFVNGLESEALSLLGRFHGENPLKRGMSVEELRTRFPSYIDAKLIEFTLGRMNSAGSVVLEGETVRRADFTLTLSGEDEQTRKRVLEAVTSRGYEAPTLPEAAEALGEEPASVKPVMDFLVTDGVLIRTKEGYYFGAGMIDKLVAAVIDILTERGELTVADIKQVAGTSRKYTIPLLEMLDSRKITIRKGDVRVAGPKGKR